jgi:hypothetical protein
VETPSIEILAISERIFSGKVVKVEKIVERVKFVSWKLLLAKKQNSSCLLYEWGMKPFLIV